MDKNVYCPIIHGGLDIKIHRYTDKVAIKSCCLQTNKIEISKTDDIWDNRQFKIERENNLKGIWKKECWTCKANENSKVASFRTGMVEKFGYKTNLSGPLRLDLMITNGCNLACRLCGPGLSTYWEKHLKENNIPIKFDIMSDESKKLEKMMDVIKKLDLSNLEMVVYCGGETLMGNDYWKMTEYLIENTINSDKNLTICFQTNGTMPIDKKYYKLIEKCHLVKLQVSLDGISNRFEYLRWPAKWNQVVDNLLNLRKTLPPNVMFLIEETNSVFNLYYKEELKTWIRENFSTNRLGDMVNHTSHLAEGIFNLDNITNEYFEALKNKNLDSFINSEFQENPDSIKLMISKIDKFDKIRGEDWKKTFPEVAKFYKRYL